jgi:methionyl-tRNA formyltransferase
MRSVFLGAPAFALPSLEKLARSHHTVAAVVTHPDRPLGRGLKPEPTPVKRQAQKLGLPVFTPAKLEAPDFLEEMRRMQSDLMVVVAFRFLPEALYTIPPQGAINLHASLLPKYRGAAPIQWALIQGAEVTGLTTFFINRTLDQGDLLLQREVAIAPDDNFGSLSARMAEQGAELLLETIEGIEAGTLAPKKQDDSQATRAPKITKEICVIDWSRSAAKIHNLVRGLAPEPGAVTFFRGKRLKILRTRVTPAKEVGSAGAILRADPKQGLLVATPGGCLELLEVQPEGKSPISGPEFVRGYRPRTGEKLG